MNEKLLAFEIKTRYCPGVIVSNKPEPELPRQVSARWTLSLTAGGWTPVSDFFLDNYCRLVPSITHAEALMIIHLMRHKWNENAPFPSYATLARRMGVKVAAVRATARALEKKGYLKRESRLGATNRFRLEPLFSALEDVMQTFALPEAEMEP